jgi:hypothetical protein
VILEAAAALVLAPPHRTVLIGLVAAVEAGLGSAVRLEFLTGARIIFGGIVNLSLAGMSCRVVFFGVTAAAGHTAV